MSNDWNRAYVEVDFLAWLLDGCTSGGHKALFYRASPGFLVAGTLALGHKRGSGNTPRSSLPFGILLVVAIRLVVDKTAQSPESLYVDSWRGVIYHNIPLCACEPVLL